MSCHELYRLTQERMRRLLRIVTYIISTMRLLLIWTLRSWSCMTSLLSPTQPDQHVFQNLIVKIILVKKVRLFSCLIAICYEDNVKH